MNRRVWLILAIVILLLVAADAAASWFFSGIMIASPTASLEEARADTGDPADYGLPEPEEVRIDTGEVTLAGWYFDNPQDGDCGVLFMHGFTGTRYQALYFAPLFWERGCDLLAYDHRGHGDSTPAFHTYGFHEKDDALAALRWFEQRSGLDESQIGVGGVSYGAATALQLAPMIPEAPFVLADSSYSSVAAIVSVRAEARLGRALGRLLLPGALFAAERRAGFDAAAVSPEAAIAEAQMPILLIHSRTDGFTPAAHSEAIYANSDQSRTVLHVNEWGSEHASDIGTDFAAYRQLFNAFMAEYAPDFGLPVAQ
ncbi:alpha/beta hydrolase [Promineifilum sp.]|uniref:alpha/beta hydrolase n=1 Tax=Promineifilum sp. TaxID=2664178 RepID=UPI0035B34665